MDGIDEDEERAFNIRPLQLNDIPFCVALEQASFPPNEAATLEKVRLLISNANRRSRTESERVLK
jgi:hypothetical protein